MATIPQLTYRLVMQEGANNKLSDVPPYDECQVIFSCDQFMKTFRCRSTFEDEETGREKGILVAEFTSRPKDTELSFTIKRANAMKSGEGDYTFGLYVENNEGIWNEYVFFLTSETSGDHLKLKESEGGYFMVGESKSLTEMTIGINGTASIDLSQLTGLNSSLINWGDGTTTTDTYQHTYASAGTYTIKANFDDVTNINNYFMYNNEKITSLNLSAMSKLVRIRNSFCNNCTNLTTITFSVDANVTALGTNFCAGCTHLTAINLDHFTNLTQIPDSFLSNTAIASFDLTKFTKVTNIGANFLNNTDISAISFDGLNDLAVIGNNFLANTDVVTVNLATKVTLTSIGSNFLNNCTSLTTLYVPYKSTPPTLGSWGILNALAIIHCDTYVDIYKEANVWKEKKDKMQV